MKKQRFRRHSYSIVDNMKVIVLLALPIIIINIILSSISLVNIRQQNFELIHDSVTLYQSETAAKLRSVEHFIEWTIVNDPLFTELEQADTPYERTNAMNAIRARVDDSQYATGKEYHYFAYLEQKDLFFNASDMLFSYADYCNIKNYIINATKESSIKNNFNWQFAKIGDLNFLYYIIHYDNRTFGAFVDVADLTAPLSNTNLGEKGGFSVCGLDDNIVFCFPSSYIPEDASGNSLFHDLHTFSGEEYGLPYHIMLYSDNFNSFGRVFFFQLFVILTGLLLCVVLSTFIIHMYKKVIQPIQVFSDSLANINEQEDIIDLQSNNIRELEQASLQFKNLIREIKKLKINVYENELEKKRFQITFLQNQIRPHFYLNCLTTISSMAQLGNYKDIQSMVLFTSRYLRYLFQTDRELTCIEYELSHIEAYLDIQSLRFGSVFTYDCSIAESDKRALIPPLLLITFVENSLKHSCTTDNELHLTISISRASKEDRCFLEIDVIDSGQGFPESVLTKLAHGEPINSDEQMHIGITNSMERLSLLYGTNYEIHFFNEPHGGAHVRLLIPYQIQENENECIDCR